MAWEIALEVLDERGASEVQNWDHDGDASLLYWQQVQPKLANAFVLVQQAQELNIKSRIAEVSPFLLLAGDPREWPRGCDKSDVPFSAFRTVDASDLIRLHNAVSAQRLSDSFATLYDEVRQHRNILMHHGHAGARIEPMEILRLTLTTHKHLFDGKWGPARATYWNSGSTATLYTNKWTHDALLREFEAIVELLKPAELREFFGYDKRQRHYLCPQCVMRARDARVPLAELRSRAKTESKLYCFLCNVEFEIERAKCSHADCKSTVIALNYFNDRVCLTCDRVQ
ncbi:MAG: hypothetical protein HC869_19430 [Rhodospirillales bacterium]|nr:hypothetical protein [Rhodospirillales bacterium]